MDYLGQSYFLLSAMFHCDWSGRHPVYERRMRERCKNQIRAMIAKSSRKSIDLAAELCADKN
jgi:hypothetical protein